VWTIPMSQMKIPSRDLEKDHLETSAPEERKGALASAGAEAEDRFISERVSNSIQPPLTENDYRDRMTRFLATTDSQGMPAKMRKVCSLWAQGKKQREIEVESGIDQSTASRLIRAGKAMLYSR
ncbi:MAG: hypothetical protein WB780_21275, partial [Candidatus Acidiferrales bacterium]